MNITKGDSNSKKKEWNNTNYTNIIRIGELIKSKPIFEVFIKKLKE